MRACLAAAAAAAPASGRCQGAPPQFKVAAGMASAGEWVREHCVRFVLAKAGMQLMGRNRISLGMHCLRAWVVTAQGKQSGRFAAVQIVCLLLLCLPVVE